MAPLRTLSLSTRAAWALVIALLLAVRLLGATGYMPAFERGAVTIIVCPDADANAPMALGEAHHHHGKTKHDHGACPYASASGLSALGADFGPLPLSILVFGAILLRGQTLVFAELRRPHERPPLRGPPIPA